MRLSMANKDISIKAKDRMQIGIHLYIIGESIVAIKAQIIKVISEYIK